MFATSPWSLWILIPAYIMGIAVFGGLMLYGVGLLTLNGRESGARRSTWPAYSLIYFALVGAPAYFAAWKEKRVVAAFAEWLVAYMLFYGIGLGGIAAGALAGYKLYKRTASLWMGWVVGLLIGLAVGATIWGLGSQIPGIGWRMEKISEDSNDADYEVIP